MYRLFSIFTGLLLIGACSTATYEEVPYPSLHGQFTYFQEKLDQYASFPVGHDDVILLGDDLFDRGIWNLFYDDPGIKNRGIALEGTECTLYRIDSFARRSPEAILISTGLFDLKNGRSTAGTTERILEIYDRSRHFSKGTKTYVIGIVPDRALKKMSVGDISYKDSVEAINGALKKKLKKHFIDISSGLTDQTGYLSSRYSFDGVRINGAGYEKIAKLLSPYVKARARNSIKNDPLMKDSGFSGDELLDFYQACYNSRYEGKSAHYKARLSIFHSIPNSRKDVVMLGNSLTNNCFWEEQGISPDYRFINKGISGDEVMDIYLRLEDVIDERPSRIFMMAGVNDFINDGNASAKDTWRHYALVLKKLRKELPGCRITVFSSLPLNPVSPYYKGRNDKIRELNDSLSTHTAFGYSYIDLSRKLKDGNLDLDKRFTYDGIHLNQKGYDRCIAEIKTGLISK